jgi:hypothetical protein
MPHVIQKLYLKKQLKNYTLKKLKNYEVASQFISWAMIAFRTVIVSIDGGLRFGGDCVILIVLIVSVDKLTQF